MLDMERTIRLTFNDETHYINRNSGITEEDKELFNCPIFEMEVTYWTFDRTTLLYGRQDNLVDGRMCWTLVLE
jgi:hypothetical protein